MSFLVLWSVLACVALGLHIYSSVTKHTDRYIIAKNLSLYGYMLAAIMTTYLDSNIYEVQWFIASLDLDWGWSVQAKSLFYIILMFALSLFSHERKIDRWTLPILSSLVILSSYSYQMVLLYSLISYVSLLKKNSDSKLIFFPTILLVLMSYEKIWQSSHLLNLSEVTNDSVIGIFAVAFMGALYCFHIIRILRVEDSIKPSSLIGISITQYTAYQTLSPYFSSEILVCLISIIGLFWLVLSFISLLSRSQRSIERLSLQTYIFQLALCALLPISLDFTHYLVLGLGLLPLLHTSIEKDETKTPISELYVLFVSYIRSLAPISWLCIWPIFELTQVTGFSYYAVLVLYILGCIYTIVHVSKLKISINIEGLKNYGVEYIVWLLKFGILVSFYIIPIKFLIGERFQIIFNTMISSPLYWFIFILWFGYLFYRIITKNNKEKEVVEGYLSNSTNGQIFESILSMFNVITNISQKTFLNIFDFLFKLVAVTLSLMKDGLHVLAISFSTGTKRISNSYELVGIAFISLFFVYYMWRYGL